MCKLPVPSDAEIEREALKTFGCFATATFLTMNKRFNVRAPNDAAVL
jgi:hypothetical protein